MIAEKEKERGRESHVGSFLNFQYQTISDIQASKCELVDERACSEGLEDGGTCTCRGEGKRKDRCKGGVRYI